MLDFGNFILVTAWVVTTIGFILGIKGAISKKTNYVQASKNCISLSFIFSSAALLYLAVSFIKHNYNYLYVWQNSNNEMPWYYLVSAIWGGMAGSMLLWAFLMSLFSAIVISKLDQVPRDINNWLMPVLNISCNFFLLVVVFLTNPFVLIPENAAPFDGNGLNPLLQNPSMLIHPPMLYLGFTGFVIPFSFCLAALLSGNLKDHWITLTRRYTLVAWAFLTTGIILGGNWAYIELGWGGFWAWDPVENASFLPWLTGTAFIHSVMVQQQKGMLKVWNAFLSILTYTLAVFGTFLTRSGVVQSVHAFAETDVGWVFLGYIAVIIVVSTILIVYRFKELESDRYLESYFSREAAFLFNNLILLSICFATLWGVMYPVISEAITGQKSVVGPPFFNKVNLPLFLILIFLMGVGPLIAWTKNNFNQWIKTFIGPLISGTVLTSFFIWIDSSKIYSAISFGICLFVLMTIEAEFRRAKSKISGLTQESLLTKEVIKRRPKKFGGLIVHLGVAIMAVAITASMGFKTEKEISLKLGEKAVVGRYALELIDMSEQDFGDYTALISKIKISNSANSEFLTYLNPERRLYKKSQEMTSEVDMRITLRDDLYLALTGTETAEANMEGHVANTIPPALIKVFINPLQVWLWFGGLVMLVGTFVVIAASVFVPVKVKEDNLLFEQEIGKV